MMVLTILATSIVMLSLVVDGFTIPMRSQPYIISRLLKQRCYPLRSSPSETNIVDAQTEKEDELLPILRKAMPTQTITSYQILNEIVQTGAVGTRILIHHRDTSKEKEESTTQVFVKQISAEPFAGKSFAEMKRYLLYARTEVRFYKEILPLLYQRGILDEKNSMAPHCYFAEYNLEGLIDDKEHVLDESKDYTPTAKDLEGKGGTLVLESVNENEYFQESPLTIEQSSQCLASIAKLHAAAWQDATLLQTIEQELSKGAHHLRMRNPNELRDIVDTWEKFMANFLEKEAPDLCQSSSIQNLGKRIYDIAEYISDEVSPKPEDKYATIAHGDYKAMNVFLPRPEEKENKRGAVVIDYASVGVGLGMSDVAMHIVHAVTSTDLDNGGEEKLIQHYLDTLEKALNERNGAALHYPKDVAMRHYRLASIDYFRFVLGRFWKGDAIREGFEKRKKNRNTTLVNRNVESAIAFIKKVNDYLDEFEAEFEKLKKND